MSGLIYKEIVTNRKTLILMAVVSTILSSIFFLQPEEADIPSTIYYLLGMMTFVFVFFIIGMMQPMIFEADETKRWAYFISSSPKAARGQVESKYIFILMISFGAMILCMVINDLAELINGVPDMFLLIYNLLIIQIFLMALELPFIFRFGSKAGGSYKAAVFIIAFLAVIAYLLFGDISMFNNIDALYEKIIAFFNGEIPDGLYIFMAVSPYAVGIVYYISYRISVKLYLKGAENYD